MPTKPPLKISDASGLISELQPTDQFVMLRLGAAPGQKNVRATAQSVVDYVRTQGTGNGTADKFTAPFTFSLAGGKTFGKYTDGQTAPWTGLTAVEAIKEAGTETKLPSYSVASINVSMSAPQDGETGESVSNTVTGTFNRGDAGAETGMRLYRGNGAQIGAGQTSSPISRTAQMVRGASPTPIWAVADYGQGDKKNVTPGNTPDTRPYAVRNPNAPQAGEVGFQSQVIYLNGYYRMFYGPVSNAPTTSAQVRALPSNQLTSQGNQFTLNTGTSFSQYAVWLPPGKFITSVVDLDALSADLTGQYVASGLNASDAGGNSVAGTLFLMSAAVPYSSNHRHLISTN